MRAFSTGMIVRLALAVAIITSPAFGENVTSPMATAQARELAGLLRPISDVQVSSNVDRAKGVISGNMLRTTLVARGRGCDPLMAACKDTADRLAIAEARRQIEEHRRFSVSSFAIILDAKMKPDDIKRAVEFLKSPAGTALASSLASASDQQSWSPDLRAQLERMSQDFTAAETKARAALNEQFFDETKSLPRRALPIAPPPPSAPRGESK